MSRTARALEKFAMNPLLTVDTDQLTGQGKAKADELAEQLKGAGNVVKNTATDSASDVKGKAVSGAEQAQKFLNDLWNKGDATTRKLISDTASVLPFGGAGFRDATGRSYADRAGEKVPVDDAAVGEISKNIEQMGPPISFKGSAEEGKKELTPEVVEALKAGATRGDIIKLLEKSQEAQPYKTEFGAAGALGGAGLAAAVTALLSKKEKRLRNTIIAALLGGLGGGLGGAAYGIGQRKTNAVVEGNRLSDALQAAEAAKAPKGKEATAGMGDVEKLPETAVGAVKGALGSNISLPILTNSMVRDAIVANQLSAEQARAAGKYPNSHDANQAALEALPYKTEFGAAGGLTGGSVAALIAALMSEKGKKLRNALIAGTGGAALGVGAGVGGGIMARENDIKKLDQIA